ncbi:MAG TPA: 3-oxoacyl-[acyl-carrier-protein] synthase III C-terminal domain-containing protein [Acidimicrobiales bacterium]|nr:3-oxoacyl-[acyl-carrier-protein] synthase III C-terminal domain-containing protein [Acidimicrobiales bacterium]
MATIVESVAAAVGRPHRVRTGGARHLAGAAARQALRRAGLAACDVDLLVNAGLYHERNMGEPALAALIQEDIGANPEDPHPGGHGTFSFDVANGACGMLTGLQIADGFVRAGTVRHALVVASDAHPGRHTAHRFPFRPAAAAIVCGAAPGDRGLAGFRFAQRDGTEPDLRARVAFAGGRNVLSVEAAPGTAAAATACAAGVVSALLADLGVTPGEVDLVVANPLDPDGHARLVDATGLPAGALVTVPAAAHVHTAGLGLALDRGLAAAGSLEGRTILLVSTGAGPVAGAALLRQ